MKKPPCPSHSYSFLSFSSLRLLPVPQTPCSLPLEGSPPQPILVQLPSTTNFNVSSSSNLLWHVTLTSSSRLECWIQTPTQLFSQLQGLLLVPQDSMFKHLFSLHSLPLVISTTNNHCLKHLNTSDF